MYYFNTEGVFMAEGKQPEQAEQVKDERNGQRQAEEVNAGSDEQEQAEQVNAERNGQRQAEEVNAGSDEQEQAEQVNTEISEQIRTLRAEIDALQVHVMSVTPQRWYKQAASIVAVLALLFSFGTTAVSSYKTHQDAFANKRAELRLLIQRMSALPRENVELTAQYKDQPLVAAQMSGTVNQENMVIASQAQELINQIPDHVAPAEYLTVGRALAASGGYSEAKRLFEGAKDKAVKGPSAIDEVEAYRALAAYNFMVGEVNMGRENYENAMRVFENRQSQIENPPVEAREFVIATNVMTGMGWTQSEAYVGECEKAKNQLEGTKAIFAELPSISSWRPTFEPQITETEGFVHRCFEGELIAPINP
jgi:hypothetical protein